MNIRANFPDELEVLVDHPRGSFVKRREDGSIEYISPLPSPFNYGNVPDTLAPDGDREDAIVLGPRVRSGSRVRLPVQARVLFVDAGAQDPKWICGTELGRFDRMLVVAFFQTYAVLKTLLYFLRGRPSICSYHGLELR